MRQFEKLSEQDLIDSIIPKLNPPIVRDSYDDDGYDRVRVYSSKRKYTEYTQYGEMVGAIDFEITRTKEHVRDPDTARLYMHANLEAALEYAFDYAMNLAKLSRSHPFPEDED